LKSSIDLFSDVDDGEDTGSHAKSQKQQDVMSQTKSVRSTQDSEDIPLQSLKNEILKKNEIDRQIDSVNENKKPNGGKVLKIVDNSMTTKQVKPHTSVASKRAAFQDENREKIIPKNKFKRIRMVESDSSDDDKEKQLSKLKQVPSGKFAYKC
jgi:hypothetical protein